MRVCQRQWPHRAGAARREQSVGSCAPKTHPIGLELCGGAIVRVLVLCITFSTDHRSGNVAVTICSMRFTIDVLSASNAALDSPGVRNGVCKWPTGMWEPV
jgi:hypothetical protein